MKTPSNNRKKKKDIVESVVPIVVPVKGKRKSKKLENKYKFGRGVGLALYNSFRKYVSSKSKLSTVELNALWTKHKIDVYESYSGGVPIVDLVEYVYENILECRNYKPSDSELLLNLYVNEFAWFRASDDLYEGYKQYKDKLNPSDIIRVDLSLLRNVIEFGNDSEYIWEGHWSNIMFEWGSFYQKYANHIRALRDDSPLPMFVYKGFEDVPDKCHNVIDFTLEIDEEAAAAKKDAEKVSSKVEPVVPVIGADIDVEIEKQRLRIREKELDDQRIDKVGKMISDLKQDYKDGLIDKETYQIAYKKLISLL
jgi:hypothetical protein